MEKRWPLRRGTALLQLYTIFLSADISGGDKPLRRCPQNHATIHELLHKTKRAFKALIQRDNIFEDLGFDYFTTTLSISPHKNSKWINEIGNELENKYNIKYLYSDFKKEEGYKHSIELSKEYGLYRQDYCGCVYSIKERLEEKN